MQEVNNYEGKTENMAEEPQVNTIGVGIDIETVRSSARE